MQSQSITIPRGRIARVCRHCGVSFAAQLSRVNAGGGNYCSRPCRDCAATSTEADFWARVEKGDGCWLWTGSCDTHGYGQFTMRRKAYLAPRLAWAFTYGAIPDGMIVCHNCPGGDNPRCVRPEHLFLGSHLDNRRDCIGKGRHHSPRGEAQAGAKLTDAAVREIRQKYIPVTYGYRKLAQEYGVTSRAVACVVKGINWRHVPD